MRMGTPSRARNCLGWGLGCGPAMRVPIPAAGRMTKTCMALRVYNLVATASLDFDAPFRQSGRRSDKEGFIRRFAACVVPGRPRSGCKDRKHEAECESPARLATAR